MNCPKQHVVAKEGLETQQLITVLEQFVHSIKKVRRDNQQIAEQFGKRTIETVQKSGEIFYMGSCIEMVPLFLLQLKKEHPDPSKLSLACELLQWKANNQISIHFFIKDESVVPTRIIDFVRDNEIRIYQGNYQNPRAGKLINALAFFSLSVGQLQQSDNLLSLAEKLQLPLGKDVLEKMIATYQGDNTIKEFAKYSKRSPLKIIVDTNHPRGENKENIPNTIASNLLQTLGND